MIKKHSYFMIFTVLIYGLSSVLTVQAVCPICTVAVASGVGLSRWFGVDDLISGLWLGGLIVSFVYWTITWMEKHDICFSGQTIITTGAYYLLVFVPLYFTSVIGHPDNIYLGTDKLILGSIVGSVAFFVGVWWYELLKKKNKGHAYFPFQKVVMPILPLIIINLIFYFIL